MRRTIRIAAAFGLLALLTVTIGAGAQIDKVLKGGGIAFVISKFGPDINKFINGLTGTKKDSDDFATKVVPILSAGSGAYAGAVQVAGPEEAVRQVEAVAQIEGNFRPAGVRARALIPIASKNVTNIKRVQGVGVSGLIDIKL